MAKDRVSLKLEGVVDMCYIDTFEDEDAGTKKDTMRMSVISRDDRGISDIVKIKLDKCPIDFFKSGQKISIPVVVSPWMNKEKGMNGMTITYYHHGDSVKKG